MLKKVMKQWQHLFKLDPAKEISDENLQKICESGTDAIIIGGTDQNTEENVMELLFRVRQYAVPCIQEISSMDAISPGFDYYFIPMVLNSNEKKWLMDIHHEAIKQYKSMINWDEIVMEGYCILNDQSKAFVKTNSFLPTAEDVLSYAVMAEHLFKLPIFYLEYSGVYGDVNLVEKVKNELQDTLLIYGGGISSESEAKEMSQQADIIVVGNSIYTDFNEALATVLAVKR